MGVSGRPAGRVCRAASARRRLTRVQQRRPQVTHSHTHTLTHTHTHSLSLTHTQALTHSSTHTLLTHSVTHPNHFCPVILTPSLTLSYYPAVSLTHSLTHSLTYKHVLPSTITLPLFLPPLYHTATHTFTHFINQTFTHSFTHSLIYHVLTHAMHSVSDLRIEPFDNQVQNSIDEFVAKWRKLDSEFLKKRKKREGNRGRTVGSLHLALPYGLDLWNIEGSFENTHHDRIPDEKKVM